MTDRPRRTNEREEDVELGEEIEGRRGPQAGPVVAVRMPRELLTRVSEYAQRRNLTVSEVLRQGAEQVVGGTFQLGPTYVSGVSLFGQSVVTGSPSIGRDYAWRNISFAFRPDMEWRTEPMWPHVEAEPSVPEKSISADQGR